MHKEHFTVRLDWFKPSILIDLSIDRYSSLHQNVLDPRELGIKLSDQRAEGITRDRQLFRAVRMLA